MAQYQKPLPIPNEDTRPFWDGLKEHKLKIQKCRQCEQFRFPPRVICPHCMSLESEWVEAKGTGTVYSFTIVHHAYTPAYESEIPYVVAIIELEEGIHLISNIVGCRPEQVQIGMPVELAFEDVTPELTLHRFRPVTLPP
jgi:uncharacterized OB-fold protein